MTNQEIADALAAQGFTIATMPGPPGGLKGFNIPGPPGVGFFTLVTVLTFYGIEVLTIIGRQLIPTQPPAIPGLTADDIHDARALFGDIHFFDDTLVQEAKINLSSVIDVEAFFSTPKSARTPANMSSAQLAGSFFPGQVSEFFGARSTMNPDPDNPDFDMSPGMPGGPGPNGVSPSAGLSGPSDGGGFGPAGDAQS